MSFGALPPVDATTLPADIRDAAPARKEAYTAALGFEQMLVQQLTRQLAESARSAMGGDSPYASMMPTAMADGIMGAGGLGLARQLTDAAAPAEPVDTTGTTVPAEARSADHERLDADLQIDTRGWMPRGGDQR